MLRSVASEVVTTSSPKHPDSAPDDLVTLKKSSADSAQMISNLTKNKFSDKRKKKSVNVSSDDDDEENENGNVKNEDVLLDEDEARLEDLVFGNEKNIFENIKKK